jgi:hypothetical protein
LEVGAAVPAAAVAGAACAFGAAQKKQWFPSSFFLAAAGLRFWGGAMEAGDAGETAEAAAAG